MQSRTPGTASCMGDTGHRLHAAEPSTPTDGESNNMSQLVKRCLPKACAGPTQASSRAIHCLTDSTVSSKRAKRAPRREFRPCQCQRSYTIEYSSIAAHISLQLFVLLHERLHELRPIRSSRQKRELLLQVLDLQLQLEDNGLRHCCEISHSILSQLSRPVPPPQPDLDNNVSFTPLSVGWKVQLQYYSTAVLFVLTFGSRHPRQRCRFFTPTADWKMTILQTGIKYNDIFVYMFGK